MAQLRDLEQQQARVSSEQVGANHLALPNLSQLGVTDRPGGSGSGSGSGSRSAKEGQVRDCG